MKISLLFPPPAELTQPYLAIPALAGYLRSHGFDDVEQRDLGLEAFDTLSQPDNLRRLYAHVSKELEELDGRPFLGAADVLRYDALARAVATGNGLADEIEPAKDFFRRRLTEDAIDEYRRSADRVFAAFRLISAAHHPTEWTEHHFTMQRSRRLPGPVIIERARDARDNPLVSYMRRLAPDILASDPRLIGISVAFGTQLIPTLTLAAALRDAGCRAHIVIGGAFISHCAPRIPATPALFDIVDSFVTFSGEIPLLRLAEALRDDKPLSSVPSLIYRDGSTVRTVPRAEPPPLADLPPPDFRGLDLGQYFSPRPILPVLTSRGCYFDKCTFCSHTFSYDGRYERHAVDHVITDVRALQERHGAANFYFVDECLSPSFVRLIANRLLEEKIDIQWIADVRYENAFSRDLLALAYYSGCRMLAFGLESINQRVADLMDKGTTRAWTERILTDCDAIGIASNVMFFIGFPSETKEEAVETLDFVLDHREKVDMVSMGTFQYNKNAKMHLIAHTVGLEVRRSNADNELTDYYRYVANSGMTEMQAAELEDDFLRQFRDEGYDYPLMSRTHALMVRRGLYGFRNGHRAAARATADARPVPGEPFAIDRRHYRVADVRAAARAALDRIRARALVHLEDADAALSGIPDTILPQPTWVLAGRTMRDWAADITEADVALLRRIEGLSSLRSLAREHGGLAHVWRLLHLEQLGAVRFEPTQAMEGVSP